ncbi:MAG: NAD(P)/FAD-dependent oxidoreductase [candidate division KSB1 bacterium]|nr:NAD(P)/FAD-dependent oxidoreductase [candidate division KSB1 bacterium]
MKSEYDVIVIGAGPAGTTAARFAARGGASVLVLEKDRDIGIPVRCAEGVSEKGLLESVDRIHPDWIEQVIARVNLYSPAGQAVSASLENEKGFILNRKRFDYDLARLAVDAGADVLTRAYVYGLVKPDNAVTGVRMTHLGKHVEIKAKIVIGADGVESRAGRWAGISTHTSLSDIETCYQVTAANVHAREDTLHMYFSTHLAPQGYVWVFPKGEGVANIGLGISGTFAAEKTPREYLVEFMQAFFPEASVLSAVAGSVPCDQTLDCITADGFMLAGDAAHQANPMSGGGIASGMLAGQFAGRVAAKAVAEQNVSAKRLKEYEKLWHKKEGRNHRLSYKIKNYVYNLTDDELETIATSVLKIPENKRTFISLFKIALFKKPGLILDAIKVFS